MKTEQNVDKELNELKFQRKKINHIQNKDC